MCTVSFVPEPEGGFYFAMNRDESISRVQALPPAIATREGVRCVYPHEPTGGTWISANDAGICLALVNWHPVRCAPAGELISRGEVVRTLAAKGTVEQVARGLRKLSLGCFRPFRLVAVSPRERMVIEARWNLADLSFQVHAWRMRHWFSSGFDEAEVERRREEVCRRAAAREQAGSLAWLRSLHASHRPRRSPYSICMHRPEARTVSYTEIAVSTTQLTMRYQPSSPCERCPVVLQNLALTGGVSGDAPRGTSGPVDRRSRGVAA